MNYDNPTFRDAVAVDLVKLVEDPNDDVLNDIANDNVYLANEHVNWSPMEYERWFLHRNYRINLVNLTPDWSEISYAANGET